MKDDSSAVDEQFAEMAAYMSLNRHFTHERNTSPLARSQHRTDASVRPCGRHEFDTVLQNKCMDSYYNRTQFMVMPTSKFSHVMETSLYIPYATIGDCRSGWPRSQGVNIGRVGNEAQTSTNCTNRTFK